MKKNRSKGSPRKRRPLYYVDNPRTLELKWLDDLPPAKPVAVHGAAPAPADGSSSNGRKNGDGESEQRQTSGKRSGLPHASGRIRRGSGRRSSSGRGPVRRGESPPAVFGRSVDTDGPRKGAGDGVVASVLPPGFSEDISDIIAVVATLQTESKESADALAALLREELPAKVPAATVHIPRERVEAGSLDRSFGLASGAGVAAGAGSAVAASTAGAGVGAGSDVGAGAGAIKLPYFPASAQMPGASLLFGSRSYYFNEGEAETSVRVPFAISFADSGYTLVAMADHPFCGCTVSGKRANEAEVTLFRQEAGAELEGELQWIAIGLSPAK